MYRHRSLGRPSVLHTWTHLHQYSGCSAAFHASLCSRSLTSCSTLPLSVLRCFSTALTPSTLALHSSRSRLLSPSSATPSTSVRHYTRKKKRKAAQQSNGSNSSSSPPASISPSSSSPLPSSRSSSTPTSQSPRSQPSPARYYTSASKDDFSSASGSASPYADSERVGLPAAGDAEEPLYGDVRFDSDPTSSLDEERRAFEEEKAARRYKSRKRPDRTPFNPLPETYDDDEEVDLPPEVTMERGAYEELSDEDQLRIRTHQGLIRLRRNEQKLQRLLQMEKPDKLDLLMLLNEVEQLEGREWRMHEKYLGPKLGFEQMQDDLNYLHAWAGMEETDEPEIVGDSERVALMRERRAEEEGDEVPKKAAKEATGLASRLITSEAMWEAEHQRRLKDLADRKRRAADSGDPDDFFDDEDPARLRLQEAHAQLRAREAKENPPPLYSEPLMRDEAEKAELDAMRDEFPEGYQEDYEDDEFFQTPEEKDADMEVELLAAAEAEDSVGVIVGGTPRTAEQKKADAAELEQLMKEPGAKALLGDEEVLRLLEKEGPLTAEEQQRVDAALQQDDEEFATLQEHTGVWRVKQEMVAELRAAVKAAGGTLDEAKVAEFMSEDDDSAEARVRDYDEVVREADIAGELFIERFQHAVRRQKKWLSELRAEVGEQKVKELVRTGAIQLKTFATANALLWDDVQKAHDQGLQLVEQLEAELEALDRQTAETLGISVEDVRKMQVDGSDVKLPTFEQVQARIAELRPAREMAAIQKFADDFDALTHRDLLAEADAAAAQGDDLAATKLRLMHARRLQAEREPVDPVTSARREELQRAGQVLSDGTGEAEVLQPIQRLKYGRLSAEEVQVNRQLIARGDGGDARFVDEEMEDQAALRPPAITLPASALRIREEGARVGDDEEEDRREAGARLTGQALVDAHNAAVTEYEGMTEEQKFQFGEERELLHKEDFEEFDDFILSQLPLKLHKRAVKRWKLLSEEDRRKVIRQGRENREALKGWMGARAVEETEQGQDVDELTQYFIHEQDPKIYGAIEGAFWHVGRWGLDERTAEQKEESARRRIVHRFRPDTPDTQQLLDRIEEELFAERNLTEEKIDHWEDMTDEDRQVYKRRLREAQGLPSTPGRRVEVKVTSGSQTAAGQNVIEADQPPAGALISSAVTTVTATEESPEEESEREARLMGKDGEEGGEDDDKGREHDKVHAVEEEEGRARDHVDRFDLLHEEEDDPDVEDEADLRAEEAGEEEDEDEDGEDDEETEDLSAVPPIEEGEESELQQRKREENARRRQLFQDFDPVPTGDQRAFDDRYFHFDEEDWALLQKLDPAGVADHKYRPPVSEQTAYNQYNNDMLKGQNVLSEDTRKALYYLHRSNPSVWTPSALAMKFRMAHAHVKGILLIEAADQRAVDHRLADDPDPGDETAQHAADLRELKSLLSAWKFRQHMIRRGHDGEIIEQLDKEGADMHNVEAMLHTLPRLSRPRVADTRFVSENDLQAVLDEEREVEERFLSYQQRQAKREAEEYARKGAIGTPTHPRFARKVDPLSSYQHPKIVEEGGLTPPVNYHVVLTDITERGRDRFSLAVRDVTGYLREPTPVEFMQVRRREKSEKARFVHVEYRHEKGTPL